MTCRVFVLKLVFLRLHDPASAAASVHECGPAAVCAYFKGVDGFPLKAHGSSKRSVKLASEGE